ncbi:TPA: conserved phage C-terminal domain-containing protein, partial [Citrobacter freundii]
HLSESDASKSDPSKSDASKSDPSKFEASKSSKKGGFDPSESGGDPSVKSKQDPQVTSKPSCPVAAQPDREVLITDQAKSVLSHLNQVTNSRYQVSTTSMQNIRARIGEGFTVEELSLVVDYCNAKWGDDLKMSDYLRPQTLFQPSKFPGYLKSANNWDKAGRPERVNGEWAREDGIFKPSFKNTDYSAIPPGFRG